MKFVKKLLKTLLVVVVLVVAAAFLIPIFFKDQIVAVVKEQINETLNATVDFDDVDVSLLRDFPNISAELQNYSVTGKDRFEGVVLAKGKGLDLAMDFWSVVQSEDPVKLHEVHLDEPVIRIVVLRDGTPNWDIMKPVPDTGEPSAEMIIELDEYSISNGQFIYDDRLLDTYLEMKAIDHEGSGKTNIEVFDLDTETTVGAFTLDYEGIRYFNKVKTTLDAIIGIDTRTFKYSFADAALTLNDLLVNVDGYLEMPEADIDMDLKFNAPGGQFRQFLSLIPNAYSADFGNVDVAGSLTLNGAVKGTYSADGRLPAFSINFGIDNGRFKYPDLPIGINDIFADAIIKSPSNNLDQLTVDFSRFNMNVGDNPIEGYFKLRTPMSNPQVDTKINGRLDLAELGRAFPMEGTEMSGIIIADVTAKADYATYERGDYENLDLDGTMQIQNLAYNAADMPPVRINSLNADFDPKQVTVENLDAQFGKSDLRGSGKIDNILAYFTPDQTLTGRFDLQSNYFDANEWVPENTDDGISDVAAPVAEDEAELFNRFDITVNATAKQIDYDVYKITNSRLAGHMTPERLKIDDFSTQIGDTDLAGTGTITEWWDYVFGTATLGGELNLRSDFMNLNQFMTEDGTAPASETPAAGELEPIVVPDNVDVVVRAAVDRLLYDNMTLRDLRGTLNVENSEVSMEDVTTSTLGGRIALAGAYDTSDPEKPRFEFKYDLSQLNFSETFNTFNTFQALAPVGKFIDGKLNSSLVIDGQLGKDLMPVLSTLNIEGFLQTLSGQVANLPAFEKIDQKLNTDIFKRISLEDTKNWFTVTDGLVEVKEFDWKVKDVEMKIGGSHRLDGAMSYTIFARIPREMIGKTNIGAAANRGLDLLSQQAGRLGLDIAQGEFVNLRLDLTGGLTNPDVAVKLLGTDGERSLEDEVVASIKEQVNEQVDAIRDEAQERIDAERDKAEAIVDAKVDTAKAIVNQKVDEAKRKAEQQAKDKAKDLIGDTGILPKRDSTKVDPADKIKDEFGEEADKAINDIKDKLSNPFGKKKKKDN